MLTRRSAPQPLIMKTPTGGTSRFLVRVPQSESESRQHSQRMVMRTMRMAGTASDMVLDVQNHQFSRFLGSKLLQFGATVADSSIVDVDKTLLWLWCDTTLFGLVLRAKLLWRSNCRLASLANTSTP
jgi:hypothetical protein